MDSSGLDDCSLAGLLGLRSHLEQFLLGAQPILLREPILVAARCPIALRKLLNLFA
jgi:hypothetical protein